MDQAYREAKIGRVNYGDLLVRNTEACARSVFSRVITSDGTEASSPPEVRAVLVPKVIRVDSAFLSSTVLAYKLAKQKMSLTLALELSDRSGNTVWVNTYRSEHIDKIGAGRSWKSYSQRQFEHVIKDALRQAHDTILSSPEIRAFAKSFSQ